MERLHARARVLMCAIALLFGSAAPASAAVRGQEADSGVTPVILVHGYNADPGVWGSFRADLLASGYGEGDVFAWGYDTSQSVNETLAGRFAAYVEQVRARTGARKVDIVAHSFGSLVTRWYVKYGGGTATVDHWVSLGGPNHGTGIAWACALWSQACRDMTPGSYVQTQLAQGDETPGDVRYGTWWSNCDEIVDPDDSVLLNGAENHPAGCLAHNDLLTDDKVSQQVRAFLGSRHRSSSWSVLAGHEVPYIGWFLDRGTPGRGVRADLRAAIARTYARSGVLRSALGPYRALRSSARQIRAAAGSARVTVPATAIGAHLVGRALDRQLRPLADDLEALVLEDCGHIIPWTASKPCWTSSAPSSPVRNDGPKRVDLCSAAVPADDEVTDEHAVLRSGKGVGPYLEFLRTGVKTVPDRVHLDLLRYPRDDQEAEVTRLRALGATDLDLGQGDVPWKCLADPEGHEFCILARS